MSTVPRPRRAAMMVRRRTAGAVEAVEAVQDPFRAPDPGGALQLYGPPTSRVCKVIWAAAECNAPWVRANIPLAKLKASPW